jgi:hypothetical protein
VVIIKIPDLLPFDVQLEDLHRFHHLFRRILGGNHHVDALQIRLAFQEIYRQPNWDWGALFLDRWYSWAIRSRLEPIKEAARTVMRHRDGILAWFDSQIANGLIEGINSLVQAAKAKARGYRSTRTPKAITYLIAGKLDLKLPT